MNFKYAKKHIQLCLGCEISGFCLLSFPRSPKYISPRDLCIMTLCTTAEIKKKLGVYIKKIWPSSNISSYKVSVQGNIVMAFR